MLDRGGRLGDTHVSLRCKGGEGGVRLVQELRQLNLQKVMRVCRSVQWEASSKVALASGVLKAQHCLHCWMSLRPAHT